MMRFEQLEGLKTALMLAALVGCVALAGSMMSGVDQRAITEAMLMAGIVVATYLFAGNSGVLSFGHVGFVGIGAYAGAWLTVAPSVKASLLPGLPGFLIATEAHPVAGMLAGGLLAAALAAVIGIALTRLSGIAATIGTFAMLMIAYSVYANWSSVTGGQASLYGLPDYAGLPVAAITLSLTILAAGIYQTTPSGFRLRASREDAVAATASGIDIRRERYVAFVLSAFFAGLLGALHGYFMQIIVAREYYLGMTFITVAMLIIGGMRSLTGAVVGTAIVSLLMEMLRRAEKGVDLGAFTIPGIAGLQEAGLAAAMLLLLLMRPQGLMAGRELTPPKLRLRLSSRPAPSATRNH